MTEPDYKAMCEELWGVCAEAVFAVPPNSPEAQKVFAAFMHIDKKLSDEGLLKRPVRFKEAEQRP